VHNDRVTGRRAAFALAAVVLTMSGCSGSGSSTPGAGPTGATSPTTPSASTTSDPTTSAPTTATTTTKPTKPAKPTKPTKPPKPTATIRVPAGVHLTPQGTHLRLGRAATVAWKPDQATIGVLRLAVTRLQQVRISAFRDWRLGAATRASTPFFVHVTVTNVGRSDLSHVPVPLYLLDRHKTLIQASTFRARFRACPSRPLPKRFGHGRRATVCLVYFAPRHGRLDAMSFRPSQDYSAITWRGHVHPPPSLH
jgi:hypothetical protein